MKPTPDRERLLDDVLNEDADLRAASLETLLLAARRRQGARRRNRVLLVMLVMLLALSGILAGLWTTRPTLPIAVAPSPVPPSKLVIQSAPLSADKWVQTTPSSIEIIASTTDSISVLETPRGEGPSLEINDGELFALLAGRAAAIVRLPTGPAELLVLEK